MTDWTSNDGNVRLGRIARVFPDRTSATPADDLAFIGEPPLQRIDVDAVHVSCVFSWHRQRARWLVRQWESQGYRVRLGGPAFGDPGGEFVPGMYLRPGLTITSRGCPNHCERCFVPKREGHLRLLAIAPGNDVLDNNLMACPLDHISQVVDMLRQQRGSVSLTGGLEAARMEPRRAALVASLGPKLQIAYLAYDRTEQASVLETAVGHLHGLGLRDSQLGVYVLVAFEGDTLIAAERRLRWVSSLGTRPRAMYWRGEDYERQNPTWHDLVALWSRNRIPVARDGGELCIKASKELFP